MSCGFSSTSGYRSAGRVRIALAEESSTARLRLEAVWERRPEFLTLNPAGDVPVPVENDGPP